MAWIWSAVCSRLYTGGARRRYRATDETCELCAPEDLSAHTILSYCCIVARALPERTCPVQGELVFLDFLQQAVYRLRLVGWVGVPLTPASSLSPSFGGLGWCTCDSSQQSIAFVWWVGLVYL